MINEQDAYRMMQSPLIGQSLAAPQDGIQSGVIEMKVVNYDDGESVR